ncbi:hypothetical protein DFH06DRAFT_1399001 [Mycena polygramma]|nr:hypothetical protein DFH06DRAFT_1399001 [Mycena polygramma]
MTLRRRTRTGRGVGLKAPEEVKPPGTPFPVDDVAAASVPEDLDPSSDFTALPMADVLNTLERAHTIAPAPAYTPSRHAQFEPDLSFEFSLSLDTSLDTSLVVSLISDNPALSADDSGGDISFSFALPPAPAYTLLSMYGTLDSCGASAGCAADSSFDNTSMSSPDESFELGDISFGCSSSFTLSPPPPIISDTSTRQLVLLPLPAPPPSPEAPIGPGTKAAPIGLGITGLYNHFGAPSDGMGVLWFGVSGSHSSPTSAHSSPPLLLPLDGLPTTNARATTPKPKPETTRDSHCRAHSSKNRRRRGLSAEDPQHHHFTVIDECGEFGRGGAGLGGQKRGARCGPQPLATISHSKGAPSRNKSGSKSRTQTRTRTGIERDTIRAGLSAGAWTRGQQLLHALRLLVLRHAVRPGVFGAHEPGEGRVFFLHPSLFVGAFGARGCGVGVERGSARANSNYPVHSCIGPVIEGTNTGGSHNPVRRFINSHSLGGSSTALNSIERSSQCIRQIEGEIQARLR